MFISCSHSLYGITNNADPFCGTTKKLHQYSMHSLITVILHIPISGMHELLFMHKIVLLFKLMEKKSLELTEGMGICMYTQVYFHLHSLWPLLVSSQMVVKNVVLPSCALFAGRVPSSGMFVISRLLK